MRPATSLLLSRYTSGDASLEEVRYYVDDFDWDDRTIPEHERLFLLELELIIAGIDRDISDEGELKSHIIKTSEAATDVR